MSGSAPDNAYSLSSSGYTDGLGRRVLEIDRESGEMRERLVLRPELSAFEAALRERIVRAPKLQDERFARPLSISRDEEQRLTIVSEYVGGRRLSDAIEASASAGVVAGLDAGLGLLLELLPAIGYLHGLAGYAHGCLAPGRLIASSTGQLTILDWIYGAAVERLQFTRQRLWSELRVAPPPTAGSARLDLAGDLTQAAMMAASLTVGRPLGDRDYPGGIPGLRSEILEVAQIRGTKTFASGVEAFFDRLLPTATGRSFPSADDAVLELRQLVRREIGLDACRTGWIEFLQQADTAEAERGAAGPPVIVAPAAGHEARAREAEDQRAREEAERREQERRETERRAREEAERLAREEAERKERERLEAERLARAEAERKERERLEAERREQERLEAERKAREEAECRAREEAERQERERLEMERKAREEAERKQRERAEAERVARERAEAERMQRERLEAEKRENERLEAERRAREEAERKERERVEAERTAREEAEREERGRVEAVRKAREEAEREERERVEAERLEAERRENERLDAERRARAEAERKERERAEAERIARERAEAERLERERAETERGEEGQAATAEAADEEPAQPERGGSSRRRKREKSARARKDKLRSVAPAATTAPSRASAAAPEPSAPAARTWLVPPERAAAFEPPVPDTPARPAPAPAPLPGAARSYPVYVPPADGGWVPPTPPAPLPPIVPLPPVALEPPEPRVLTPSAGPIRLKTDHGTPKAPAAATTAPAIALKKQPNVRAHEAAPPAVSMWEPDAALQGTRTREIPWKPVAAAVVLLAVGVAGYRYGGFSSGTTKAPAAQIPNARSQAAPTPAVRATTGQISVTTDPPGAKVLLDGKAAGTSPVTLQEVPPGRHTVTVAAEAGSVRRTVKVEPGATAALELSIFSGFVEIAAPIILQVSEAGRSLGTSENQIMLAPGHHELRLANKDLNYVTTQSVDVQPGEGHRLLIEAKGVANINAQPWAEVWIDGTKAGETPLANLSITLGVREIVLRNPEFGERKVVTTVVAGTPATVVVDFTKQ